MSTELTSPVRWPLARMIILLLACGFLGLAVDLRMEHVDVVKQRTIGWTPIIYSAIMTLVCLAEVIAWRNRALRAIWIVCFAAAFVVGGLGFYLHNNGNLARPPQLDMQAWTDPTMKHPRGAPPNAPMAFPGLGLLGVLASLKRFS